MKVEDVKIDLKVVPFRKTFANSGSFTWEGWLSCHGGSDALKVGYVLVGSIQGDVCYFKSFDGKDLPGAFLTSDFEPYVDPVKDNNIQTMFVCDNRTVVYLTGARRGVSACSPSDTFDPVKGLTLAYMRALGMDMKDIEIIVNPPAPAQDKPAEPQTFEVGETVKFVSDHDRPYGISDCMLSKADKKEYKIDRIDPNEGNILTFSLAGLGIPYVPYYMLEKIPRPAKPEPIPQHEVVIDGVKYVPASTDDQLKKDCMALVKPDAHCPGGYSGKIPAIKLYRERTGCGLREAKDQIDKWVGELT